MKVDLIANYDNGYAAAMAINQLWLLEPMDRVTDLHFYKSGNLMKISFKTEDPTFPFDSIMASCSDVILEIDGVAHDKNFNQLTDHTDFDGVGMHLQKMEAPTGKVLNLKPKSCGEEDKKLSGWAKVRNKIMKEKGVV